ncbi:DNA internalization-related competence protein ComEC/Rec2 [Mammaliicoccus sciuri]|uniref:DNA internalization-related competence protein ComEC/Rec2 n=1 Tax=Mammaliicoccus sciuri TaxID=1296 RepID=UPI001E403D8E|nr:DNA internalization-related competence protein ComEC/Rec2 [Mammaliicoccus sciuri]MCD8801995.1 DNA internalization-related competence protein ComEC/Rec2 [Mammaliicoccus sciuri]
MWFYFALYLLSGLIFFLHPYVSIFMLIILVISCYIKWQSLKILMMSFIFFIIGYLIYPNDPLQYYESFNVSKNHENYTEVIQFGDKLTLDGDGFQAEGQIHNQTFKAFYTIKNEKEKLKLLKKMPYLKNCRITYSVNSTLPNTNALKFQYFEFLQNHDIKGVIKIENLFLNTCSNRPLNMIERIQLYRTNLIHEMKQLDIDGVNDIIALTLGDTSYLNEERIDQLKKLGIYHLYAVSGSHVALLNIFLFKLLLRMNIKYHHAENMIFILLPIYAVLTGLSPSVLRAVGVVMVYMILNKVIKIDALQILSITFIVYTIYNPHIIFDIGFQLSYIVSTFIILCVPLIKSFNTIHKIITINVVSQLSSFVILLIHFNAFQWLGFITNFLFIPLFELIIFPLVMLFMLIFATFGKVPNLFMMLIEICMNQTFKLIDVMSHIPINELVVRNLSEWIYLIVLIVVVLVLMLFLKKKYIKSLLLFTLLVIAITYHFNHNEVIFKFLDIGQGDAMIAYHHDVNQIVMIDTGGKDKLKKKPWQTRSKISNYTDSIIVPELKEKGFQKIDYLIITHPHADHMGELATLSKQVSIKHLIINKKTWDNRELKHLLEEVKETNTEIVDSTNLSELKIGESTYKFFNQNSLNYEDKNDTSIVTEITMFGRTILTTGDATEKVENSILSQLKGHYDILKVAHHGSLTSTSDSFLLKAKPHFCVISSGRHNRHGLPKEAIVNKLKQSDCKVFNTQDYGMVQFEINKDNMIMTNGLQEHNKKAYNRQ